jgi:hypothetical protein
MTIAGLATSASAATFVDTVGGLGTADITQSGNILTIVLTEGLANPSEANQLSGIDIVLADGPGATGFGLASQSGQLIDIKTTNPGKGSYTLISGNPDHWGAGQDSGDIFLETVGAYSAGGKPRDLIVDDGGIYTNVNGSFTQHQPQIMGPATFTINLPTGYDVLSNITGVKFQYSTNAGFGDVVGGGDVPDFTPLTAVPEPATWAMMVTGLLGAGIMLRRARKAHASATTA